jgi:hypothetical protein
MAMAKNKRTVYRQKAGEKRERPASEGGPYNGKRESKATSVLIKCHREW